ncbi:hypothetical protein AVEN_227889-1 [Araneus ventricosus]|uniref:Uncharacterized protein n=1 Tax=Araneus ventricosus TaxID=182803 RepID=A0A4Y2MEX7_ARAVE|nr:hypothetical protein AVEN_227889-1 [Araneus ventricosus]
MLNIGNLPPTVDESFHQPAGLLILEGHARGHPATTSTIQQGSQPVNSHPSHRDWNHQNLTEQIVKCSTCHTGDLAPKSNLLFGCCPLD